MSLTFRLFIRNFKKRPTTNFINLLGLSLSLALVIILSTHYYGETTIDTHHNQADQIYMIGYDKPSYRPDTPGNLKAELDTKIPGIITTTRIVKNREIVFQVRNNKAVAVNLISADPEFFEIFTYNVVSGNINLAFQNPMSVVLTSAKAIELFGSDQVIGREVKINYEHLLTITAVIEPIGKSCLTFDAIIPITSNTTLHLYPEDLFTKWDFRNCQTIALADQKIDIEELSHSITQLFPKSAIDTEIKLLPLRKIYFSDLNVVFLDHIQLGDQAKVLILLLVAGLILVVAIINYNNIFTTHQLEKIKEIGIKKVIGATRHHIAKEILLESALTFLLAFIFAVGIVNIIAPTIMNYTGIDYSHKLLFSPIYLLILLLGMLILGLILGIMSLQKFTSSSTLNNLNNKLSDKINKSRTKRAFVVIQFSIAIILIAFTILVYKQVSFGSKDLGLDQENIIIIKLPRQIASKKQLLKEKLDNHTIVQKVSLSNFYPGNDLGLSRMQTLDTGEDIELTFKRIFADHEFSDLLNLEIVEGRSFLPNTTRSNIEVLVNETFVKDHDLSNPVGLTMSYTSIETVYEIIGVIKDFHFEPVNKKISPLVIIGSSNSSQLLIKIQANDINELNANLEQIKIMYAKLFPDFPIELRFLDNAVERMYQSEVKFRKTFTLFAGSSILLCCLGILALTMFACQRRIKEIGIRKVNGASIGQVMVLLSSDFIKWIVIAFLIATPIAWYAMSQWLKNFAYRTEISWWIFVLAGLTTLIIAVVTISWQTYTAATANPVKSLKSE